MTSLQKGVTVAVVQLALVASLGAKYALDRARLPRVWTQTVAYDPDLPIRGRYVSLRLRVDAGNIYGNTPLPKPNRFSFPSTSAARYSPSTGQRGTRCHLDEAGAVRRTYSGTRSGR